MNRHTPEPPEDLLEARLKQATSHFPYPPTPDLASQVERQMAAGPPAGSRSKQWLGWAVVVTLCLVVVLLAVPPVRAGVQAFLQVGVIRLWPAAPTPTVAGPPVTVTPKSQAVSPTPVIEILQLAGETTLAEAAAKVDFPIHLPAYPPELGPPDRVFYQEPGGPLLVLVWLEPERPEQVRLTLHQLGPNVLAQKIQPQIIEQTMVNGNLALWTEGPYLLELQNGRYELQRLVEGHVLIWAEEEITYRLETGLPLVEAVRVAESLR